MLESHESTASLERIRLRGPRRPRISLALVTRGHALRTLPKARCPRDIGPFALAACNGWLNGWVIMKITKTINENVELAKSLAAEDIRCGDLVAILDVVCEYPSFLWNGDSQLLSPHDPIRVRWRSAAPGRPLKVKAICLPYLLVKSPGGHHGTLDTRQCRLVRLSGAYAKKAWKQLKADAQKMEND